MELNSQTVEYISETIIIAPFNCSDKKRPTFRSQKSNSFAKLHMRKFWPSLGSCADFFELRNMTIIDGKI